MNRLQTDEVVIREAEGAIVVEVYAFLMFAYNKSRVLLSLAWRLTYRVKLGRVAAEQLVHLVGGRADVPHGDRRYTWLIPPSSLPALDSSSASPSVSFALPLESLVLQPELVIKV